MISRETIDTIFDVAKVEEIIGEYIQLKRSGSNFKGLSPFSDEKSPSFMVSPAKQIWKDFSSGKGGNVVTFLMEHEHFTYPEALRHLAKKYNIEIAEDGTKTEESQKESKKKENLYVIADYAKNFFKRQLIETEEGQNIGLAYFKERQFTDKTIEDFELGYSPKQTDAFTQEAIKKGFSKENLEEVGLSIFKENWSSDRFRERVLFPIHSFSGKIMGFGARILKTNVNAAKYLNSPESIIYSKSNILYGVFHAKQSILKEDQCFLVEGYTDVISLHQNGIKNVVASSGTALTPQQIRLIKRLTNNLVVIYDGDKAGINASFRSIDLILEQELNVKILLLPDGEDPDSFAKNKTEEEIKSFIAENSTDFIAFKAKVLLEGAQDDSVKKAEVIKNIVESISLIPDIIKQELYVKQCASLLKIREEILFRELSQLQRNKNQDQKNTRNRTNALPQLEKVVTEAVDFNSLLILEEKLLQLMLEYGSTAIDIKDQLNTENNYTTTVIEEVINQLSAEEIEFSQPFYNKLFTIIKDGYNQEELRTGNFFLKLVDEEITTKTSALLMQRHELHNWEKRAVYVPTKEMNLAKDTVDTLLRYKVKVIENLIELISVNLKEAPEQREEFLQKIMRLNALMKQLEIKLNKEV